MVQTFVNPYQQNIRTRHQMLEAVMRKLKIVKKICENNKKNNYEIYQGKKKCNMVIRSEIFFIIFKFNFWSKWF